MIAAVLRAAILKPRSASHFAGDKNERLVQQATVAHVVEESRPTAVESRQQVISIDPREFSVAVPTGGVISANGHVPGNSHKSRPGLDQPPPHQKRLPEQISSVAITKRIGLAAKIERLRDIS